MAVKRGTSRTKSRLPSGIHEIATKIDDVTPVPTKTRRFEKAKTELAAFIRPEPRGDDQVEIVDITAAVQSGTSNKTLKDLGVPSGKIEEVRQSLVEDEPDPSITKRPSLAVPTPAVREVPKPGEEFDVPEDIKAAEKEARAGVMIGTAGLSDREGGFMGSAAPAAIGKQAGVAQAVKAVKTGEFTPDEARDYIKAINDLPASGPLSDAAYIVPGVGSYKSYRDAVEGGWDPISTGMFITSTALDVVLFVSPAKAGRLTGRVLRIPKVGPMAATGTYSPKTIPPRQPQTITQTILSPTEKKTLADLLKTATTERKLTIPPKAPLDISPLTKQLFTPLTKADVKTTGQIQRKASGLHDSLNQPLAPGKVEPQPLTPRRIDTRLDTARTDLGNKTADNLRASESLEDLLNNPVYANLIPDIAQTRERIAKHEDAVQEVQKVITTIQSPVAGIHQINETQGWAQIKILLEGLKESETRLNNDIQKVIERVNKQDSKILTVGATDVGVAVTTDQDVALDPAIITETPTQKAIRTAIDTSTDKVIRTDLDTTTGKIIRTDLDTSTDKVIRTDLDTTTGKIIEEDLDTTTGKIITTDLDTPFKPEIVTPTIPEITKPPRKPPTKQPPTKPPTIKVPKTLPRFKLPKGKKLPRGFFPRVVSWPQGAVQISFNLSTGVTTYESRTPDKTKPKDGFRVTQLARTQPKERVLDMGVTDVLISSNAIRFKRSRTAKAGKDFRRSQGRL
jgi:hypothetical protein